MTTHPKPLLGIIEGFYGVYYTFPERNDLVRFAGKHGFNTYLYAPKNDRQHRARWCEDYPAAIMAQFNETIQVAREAGIDFVYGISPAGSICYSCTTDFSRLCARLESFYTIGVRAFSLLLDDYDSALQHEADRQRYKFPAVAQADLANRLFAWLKALDSACSLILCPADYSGRAPFSHSLVVLGKELHPDIDIFYTGPEICSPAISANDARQFADVLFRPPVIWDNYPVNDLGMQSELHIAPLSGRSADLLNACRGILANTMIQAEASKIPLRTLAEYIAAPGQYDPALAWDQALCEVAGEESAAALRLVAENCVQSCLGGFGDETLSTLANAARTDLLTGDNHEQSPAVRALLNYLAEIDEAAYHLKFRMQNLALRNNLLPWIEVLEHWMWMTRFSFQALRAAEAGRPYLNDLKRVHEYRELIQRHPKRTANQALLPLVDLIMNRIENDQYKRLALEWQSAIS